MFYQYLNRFHSAHLLIGNALRLGLSFRLNYNTVSETMSVTEREHRVRLWWTIYSMDRFWGLRSGLPVQVSDDDIHVDLPATPALSTERDQFSDATVQNACIKLAQLAGRISQDLYGPKTAGESFIQREQKLLIHSRQWVESLPEHLKLLPIGPNPRNVTIMHLQFNYVRLSFSALKPPTLKILLQTIMLAISPALLHMLSNKEVQSSKSLHSSPTLFTIWETCVHAAKHSASLCVEAWTSGSIGMFSYDFPAFLFTAALALLVSSYLEKGTCEVIDSVETVKEILQALAKSGNLSAIDYLEHLKFVIKCFDEAGERRASAEADQQLTNNPPTALPPVSEAHQTLPTESHAFENTHAYYFDTDAITMQTALNQTHMQDFLGQHDGNLMSYDSSTFLADPMLSFWWLDKPLYTE